MRKIIINTVIISAFSLLSACVAPGEALRGKAGEVPTGDAYFANGTEPFWTVEITHSRIAFNSANGARLVQANPGAQPSFNGERYVTPRITVDITHAACSDGMSDRRYADSVLIVTGTQSLHGCGGRVLPPAALNGTHWRIVSMDGQAVPADRPAELQFDNNRVSGTIGCNRLMGSFTSDGVRLTVSQLASTMMACPDATMQRETRLRTLLGQSLAIRFNDRGRLELTGNDHAMLLLEPII